MHCSRARFSIVGIFAGGLRRPSNVASIPPLLGHDLYARHLQHGRSLYTNQSPVDKRIHGLSVSRSLAIARPRHLKISQRPPPSRASYNTSTAGEPIIHNVFETVTGTWQYIVADPATSAAVIIDPVLDYEPATQRITTTSADTLLALAKDKRYQIKKILETHAHADHLTAATYLQKLLTETQGFKPPIGIGKRIEQVQTLFAKRYSVDQDEYNTVFDELLDDDESFTIGNLTVTARHFPGHTPDHMGYEIGGNVFCGDSLFHADIGTARCDFPGGNAADLWRTGRKLLAFADDVKIWPGHDYPPAGRDPVPWMSVGEHKRTNKHVGKDITQAEFIALRTARDAQLNAPRLLHPSLQVNIRGGNLPRAMESGHRMLHLPLTGETEW
ncbi:hypothetical protein N7492_005712 [Penicillium capsulatum]|uniref:Metallo-beta-lactamase domain-containing protein n=1 Tax=Penicillium capsulatum TaxID=69766 RepID=A0A9W9IC02_9EURO|nr:hypothetical protein N7492_005712 [Penicillium capsulatum]